VTKQVDPHSKITGTAVVTATARWKYTALFTVQDRDTQCLQQFIQKYM